MNRIFKITSAICMTMLLACCQPLEEEGVDLTHIPYDPISYNLSIPAEFPELEQPADNQLTNDGIKLGQHLFYDPILSADSTMSCASCHFPEQAFTDNLKVSFGIDGVAGQRSSMSLVNVGFNYTGLFWDGRVQSLEEQALLPVEDPIELHNDWVNVVGLLRDSETYQELFRKAFGIETTKEITKERAADAMAQFERILISGNSKFDRVIRNMDVFTEEEQLGFEMFFDKNPDVVDAECFHCHSAPLITSNEFRNNGIEGVDDVSEYPDKGRGIVTGNPFDNGKFRVPTLRNITLSAPYMHDGRIQSLDEVIDHYNKGGEDSPFKDPLIYPLGLSEEEKENLKSFLNTLVDTSYLNNPLVINPFN